MNNTRLNEHHADLGAQSKGEFLGMTGNSAWYLLGAAGLTVLLVILLWGVLGMSLLVCLTMGGILCMLSVAYVFGLKNNRPAHFDTDFFEAALVEAGVMELAFGPRTARPANPFVGDTINAAVPGRGRSAARRHAPASASARVGRSAVARKSGAAHAASARPAPIPAKRKEAAPEPVVALAAYEALRDELDHAEEVLEDVLVERGEN